MWVDELIGIAVTGDDQYVEPGGLRLGRQRRDDVVSLESLGLDVGNRECVEHLVDQRNLPLELIRAGRPRGFVLGVLHRAEGHPGYVERDCNVGRLLIAEGVDEHRGEAIHSVGGLAG